MINRLRATIQRDSLKAFDEDHAEVITECLQQIAVGEDFLRGRSHCDWHDFLAPMVALLMPLF